MGDSILHYNGGSVLAMAGKECVAIATDMRFGIKNLTVDFNFPKVFPINKNTFVGLPGLITDAQTLYEKLKFRHNLYELREGKSMEPSTFSGVLQSILYEKRFGPFFVEPVIAALDDNGQTYLCSMDLIGATSITQDFATSGTCSEAMYGLAELLWRPGFNQDELFEVISQTFLSALDRNAISGWGARVFVITKTETMSYDLKARQD